MQSYKDYLKTKKYNITYYEYNDSITKIKKEIGDNCNYFDPIDNIKSLSKKYTMIESPNFLISKAIMKEYRDKTEHFLFNAYYMWAKKKLDIEPSLKSTDKDNRKPMKDSVKIPPNQPSSNEYDDKYIKEAINYVNKNFKNNYGNLEFKDKFNPPINHKDAKTLLKHFINTKFKNFGEYQDAIVEDKSYLFHSLLSSSINIGLINPLDIIKEIKKIKSKIPINSYEAFIRQLFWREYQRYCYIYANKELSDNNYFENNKKLSVKWYKGTLGIPPVDNAIQRAFDIGYLHHIERLMVIGNFMNLSEIAPKEGFKWFMEFSLDSYEWVMYQNVYDMVFFNTGGLTMRRPYVSSSNYIIKMSNYSTKSEDKNDKNDDKKWNEIWDQLYKDFIKRNKIKLHKFRYYFPALKNIK